MAALHSSYRIVPHDERWQATFTSQLKFLREALSLSAERIEHIGSTAVPGLGAKPIVDVMIGVDSEAEYSTYVAALSTVGYECGGETVPGTLYNRKQGPPRVNAHLTVFGSEFWGEHLLFRDYLRAHPETASEYEALKRQILLDPGDLGADPPAYNAAKESFIRRVLAVASANQAPGTGRE